MERVDGANQGVDGIGQLPIELSVVRSCGVHGFQSALCPSELRAGLDDLFLNGWEGHSDMLVVIGRRVGLLPLYEHDAVSVLFARLGVQIEGFGLGRLVVRIPESLGCFADRLAECAWRSVGVFGCSGSTWRRTCLAR